MSSSSQAYIKGLATRSIRKWLRHEYGVGAYEAAMSAMSSDDRDTLESAWATTWVPVEPLAALWVGVVEHVGLARSQVDADFRLQGEFVAGDNLSGVLKSVLTFFVNPRQLFGLVPRLWGMYFKGVEVRTRLDDDELGGEIVVTGLGALSYVAPVACGWMTGALKGVGASSTAKEQSFEKGRVAADPLRFRVRWSMK